MLRAPARYVVSAAALAAVLVALLTPAEATPVAAAGGLQLVTVSAKGTFTKPGPGDVTATALCPAGAVPLAASAGVAKALVPVRMGTRVGWQAIWDVHLHQVTFPHTVTVNAVCARGAGGVRAVVRGSGLQAPIRVSSARAAASTLTVHVVHARTPPTYIPTNSRQPHPLRATCPAGSSIVGYGWRFGEKLEGILVIRSVEVEQVGGRQSVRFLLVQAQGGKGGEYEQHRFDAYATCVSAAGLRVSLQTQTFAPKKPTDGVGYAGKITCPAGTAAVGLPFFSIVGGHHENGNTTVTGRALLPGGRGSSFYIWPLVQEKLEATIRQPCARATGWTITG